jgi:cytochrome oxidase assembly protein ShyY1
VFAGTWQVARFDQKHAANNQLRADDRAPIVDVATALGPAGAATSTGKAQEFRRITAAGRYLPQFESLVRAQTVGGDVGYLVLTPFQTDQGVLLIVRGFIAQTGNAMSTPRPPPPPAATVSIAGRLQPAAIRGDRFGDLPANQVESINPVAQAKRIGMPVWPGYAQLLDDQPGGDSLKVIPAPDLSNPAGGAEEPQHAAYVVQWYLFAILALAAPFILAAAERGRTGVNSLDDRLAGNT